MKMKIVRKPERRKFMVTVRLYTYVFIRTSLYVRLYTYVFIRTYTILLVSFRSVLEYSQYLSAIIVCDLIGSILVILLFLLKSSLLLCSNLLRVCIIRLSSIIVDRPVTARCKIWEHTLFSHALSHITLHRVRETLCVALLVPACVSAVSS